jgi:ArsR family transcriptional regulator, arsenate/arsenite/antimonite-responsive transcriptional repressor / arsenate reductase (thioredoxin)
MTKLKAPPEIIKLLAHDLRWSLVLALRRSDYRVNELVNQVGEPANAVSYHLKQLREADIVHNRRSDADGRDVYYSLNITALNEQYMSVGEQLNTIVAQPHRQQDTALRVLVLCTHNSARSQMAEGFLRHYGGDALEIYSAGSHPTVVNPDAIRAMDHFGVDIRAQASNHISEYQDQSFDYVITVCDYAREVCPHFDKGEQIHWGFSDPSKVRDDNQRTTAFVDVAASIKSRIEQFLKVT